MGEGRRYRVLGVLGRGGFGTVFRADLLGEGSFVRPVALKVLNPAMEGVSSVAARLRDEARLLGRIRHRAIVQVDGLVRLDDRWTVVMEYVDGVDLGRLVDRGPVPERAAVEMIGEVAGALHVVQQWPGEDGRALGILHRDLKPANLLLTAAGEVKVLDFGGARGEFDDREAKTHGMRFGSPGYVPPERHDGDERPEGDVYSLGVVFYELLSGRRLGKASVRQERHGTHLADAFAHLPAVDPESRALLEAMLAWAPEDRPSAREVERRCRALAARVEGAFLRDWAEVMVPPLLAARQLGDARSDFSSEIVVERVSVPLGTPAPASPRPSVTQTFHDLDLDDLRAPDLPSLGGDLSPPVLAPPPARPFAEPAPPTPPEPVPAPPAIAPRPAAPRRRPSALGEVGMFVGVTSLASIAFVVAFTLLCASWAVLVWLDQAL